MDASNLPDLEYKSNKAPAPVFEELEDADGTWKKIETDIKKALVALGHNCAMRTKGKARVSFNLSC